jgi:hypothetical protein
MWVRLCLRRGRSAAIALHRHETLSADQSVERLSLAMRATLAYARWNVHVCLRRAEAPLSLSFGLTRLNQAVVPSFSCRPRHGPVSPLAKHEKSCLGVPSAWQLPQGSWLDREALHLTIAWPLFASRDQAAVAFVPPQKLGAVFLNLLFKFSTTLSNRENSCDSFLGTEQYPLSES